MNAGKSTIMNLLTQKESSIVDNTPGTTADTKQVLMEIHGIGPVKLFDTPGIDEKGELGDKKRKKAYFDLKEIDLVILIIDPRTLDFSCENKLINEVRDQGKQLLIIYNIFSKKSKERIREIKEKITFSNYFKSIIINGTKKSERYKIIDFIIKNYDSKKEDIELLPFAKNDEFYLLIIPIDEETPEGRLLRPQSLTVEYLIRHWSYPVCYRLNLCKARSKNKKEVVEEKKRFDRFLNSFKKPPAALITDSQAIDIVSRWTPANIPYTTFSITMINYLSLGNLEKFVSGVKQISLLKPGNKVLIVEACNHSRICDDIGTVQIPRYLSYISKNIQIDFNFGREFLENNELEKYDMIIHCGACMISSQQLVARIRDFENLKIPFTNYGIFLSYVQGQKTLKRALELWNVYI